MINMMQLKIGSNDHSSVSRGMLLISHTLNLTTLTVIISGTAHTEQKRNITYILP